MLCQYVDGYHHHADAPQATNETLITWRINISFPSFLQADLPQNVAIYDKTVENHAKLSNH